MRSKLFEVEANDGCSSLVVLSKIREVVKKPDGTLYLLYDGGDDEQGVKVQPAQAPAFLAALREVVNGTGEVKRLLRSEPVGPQEVDLPTPPRDPELAEAAEKVGACKERITSIPGCQYDIPGGLSVCISNLGTALARSKDRAAALRRVVEAAVEALRLFTDGKRCYYTAVPTCIERDESGPRVCAHCKALAALADLKKLEGKPDGN